MMPLLELSLLCSYPQYERIRAELGRVNALLEDTVFGADVELKLAMTAEDHAVFAPRITDLTAGTALLEITGRSLRPVPLEERS